jgi:hypothetical protein
MDDKKTVFVIEKGSYSDYRVVGVFTTRANAESVCAAINATESYEEATIAEWPLDPAVADLAQGFKVYNVQMHKDGRVERVQLEACWTYDIGGRVHEWEREEAPAYRGKGLPNLLQVECWARDEEHAIKIANDHRIQRLALGQWKGKL